MEGQTVRRKDKISKGVRMLQKQGHQVEQYTLRGKSWWQIDSRILATPEEIKQLADGVYSLRQLKKLHAEKNRLG
jgi:hypothetical protein